jgi:hypothetical protein
MTPIEELERRKQELQLRSDIAKLEREERLRASSSKIDSWSWKWVAPLSVVSLYFVLGGVEDGKPGAIVVGLVLLVPLLLKVLRSRNR